MYNNLNFKKMAKIKEMTLNEYAVKFNTANGGREAKKNFTSRVVRIIGERFVVGDTFTIPNEFSVYTMQIGDNEVEYIPIEVRDSKGSKRFTNLFPSILWRCAFEVDEKGSRVSTRPIVTGGGVYDAIRNFPTVDSRMDVLRGSTIKVTEVKDVRTLRFGTTDETIITPIYSYDFVVDRDETIRENAEKKEVVEAV